MELNNVFETKSLVKYIFLYFGSTYRALVQVFFEPADGA